MSKFLSEKRVNQLSDDCFDMCGNTYAHDIREAINQALSEQQEAIADWLEGKSSDWRYQNGEYTSVQLAKQLRDKSHE